MIDPGGYLQFPTPTAFLSLFYYFPPFYFSFLAPDNNFQTFLRLFTLQTKTSLQLFFLRSLLPFHEARPRKKVQSGRNHSSPAAGKKTQVESNPIVPSSFQRSPFVAAGKVLLCASFAFKSLIFFSFWCIRRHPLEDLTSQVPKTPFLPILFPLHQ